MIVGGVLVFLGLAFIVEWVWDKRRSLPRLEYAVVLVILAVIIARGYLAGVVVGLVLAVVLFAINYGRVDLVREVAFGQTYRSERGPPARGARGAPGPGRAGPDPAGQRVRLLRLDEPPAGADPHARRGRPTGFLVIDLRRVTGVDSSAVVAFVKVMRLAEAHGFEVVLTGPTDPVRAQLDAAGCCRPRASPFAPDLDRGLQRCEDALLAGAPAAAMAEDPRPSPDGMPEGLAAYVERVALDDGTVLLHQDDPPGDVFVFASGRLAVETVTPEGNRVRLHAPSRGRGGRDRALHRRPAHRRRGGRDPSVVLR